MKSFLQYINESKLNNTQWYFGNNRSKKLKLSQPQWYAPFFLTTDYNYAQDYSDYGVYLIDLKNESKINILDFSKITEVNKLNWPKILVDTIKNGNNDLNSIAYDLYDLAYNDGQNLTYITDSQQWKNCANYFKVKSANIMSQFKSISIWGTEKDHQFLLQMWKDIFDAKFNGFMHHEFGKEIIAIFTFKCIDKISVKPIHNILYENKQTYINKYYNEPELKSIVDKFWQIRHRLKAPQNDIDWWIKKPFNELKQFVLSFNASNKKERRESNYKQDAIENGAKLLDIKDGYEIWYVPTYEAMEILGRYYKGCSSKWCVASDDPEFWFDNHMDDEFILLIREHPQHNEFDKIALQMENHGRYYSQNEIIPWDLNNNDRTFTNDDLMHYAWLLFKDNGEVRDNYLD